MKFKIGFSPCPNDTYIFDALVNKKIDTGNLEFEPLLEDVQTLNEWAVEGRLDISKISYAALPLVLENYITLTSGGALGSGVGPLLISKTPLPEPAIRHCTIAIPGQNTTANLLFSLAYPEAVNKVFLRYDEIENFVLTSADNLDNMLAVKLGVIIHENRFTYESKNLHRVADLGEVWEKQTGFPIPLGGIVMKRNIPGEIQIRVNDLIRQSIEYANSNKKTLSDFVKTNAQEMDERVMNEHIKLYVNDYSIQLGDYGKNAVRKFLQIHSSINKLPMNMDDVFLS